MEILTISHIFQWVISIVILFLVLSLIKALKKTNQKINNLSQKNKPGLKVGSKLTSPKQLAHVESYFIMFFSTSCRFCEDTIKTIEEDGDFKYKMVAFIKNDNEDKYNSMKLRLKKLDILVFELDEEVGKKYNLTGFPFFTYVYKNTVKLNDVFISFHDVKKKINDLKAS
ncbi:hypothetical protein [Sutcliffiella horikoshii]|uniref:hypothetical protein n=1 Tax=Sutcliffiella horikoshii TaxID=79883 RepID=UPI00384F4707